MLADACEVVGEGRHPLVQLLGLDLDLVRALPAGRRILFFSGQAPPSAVGVEVMEQPEGALDVRLGHLFDAVTGPLLLIGMDTPQLTAEAVAGPVWSWPDSVDAWFGPAADGGYWALAMREPDGGLIRGVTMSAPETGREQRRRLVDAGLRVRDLETLRDVDHVEGQAELAQQRQIEPVARIVHRKARAPALCHHMRRRLSDFLYRCLGPGPEAPVRAVEGQIDRKMPPRLPRPVIFGVEA